jgi:hypothetical protein
MRGQEKLQEILPRCYQRFEIFYLILMKAGIINIFITFDFN